MERDTFGEIFDRAYNRLAYTRCSRGTKLDTGLSLLSQNQGSNEISQVFRGITDKYYWLWVCLGIPEWYLRYYSEAGIIGRNSMRESWNIFGISSEE